MSSSCAKHPHEVGAGLCRRCGDNWCRDCLIYSFGPKKPPFCRSCAMVAGGVRSTGRPAMPRKELRARMKAERQAAKAAAQDARAAESAAEAEPAVAFEATDWATPWWEDRQPTALAD